ncbi:hypothetical protein RFI_08773 [Reticulomyxa filosa]|uniref:Uncharacterized protein n=1 Tax=Reticulomyxa filosa TaxID=46433 RepID=X6NPY9_RETFI|nr:hypothetical protein RFI_08773 [Reticulomyxa filosa]|eukprot:ETO28360.1 hypothetical protein RFI_08773 [Reticulomyxa filosa]
MNKETSKISEGNKWTEKRDVKSSNVRMEWKEGEEEESNSIRAIKQEEEEKDQKIFGVCSKNRVTIYEIKEGGKVSVMSSYEDEAWDEEYVCMEWSVEKKSCSPLLLVAGRLGVIKILNCHKQELKRALQGHGGMINAIQRHGWDDSILISCSSDLSCRVWNIETGVCLLILSGQEGHRAPVLSCDIHYSGLYIATCAMDHQIKIWHVKDIFDLIQKSYQVPADHENVKSRKHPHYHHLHPLEEEESEKQKEKSKEDTFSTKMLQFPIFSKRKIHYNYVAHVQWVGDWIFSKSFDNTIRVWKPDLNDCAVYFFVYKSITTFAELKFPGTPTGLLKFQMDVRKQFLIASNGDGSIFLWNLSHFFQNYKYKLPKSLSQSQPQSQLQPQLYPFTIRLSGCPSPIRSLSIHPNLRFLLAGTDQGHLFNIELSFS